jgi:hypothetical protein
MARYRCSLNRSPRAQKNLPASAGYRGSDLVPWHFCDIPRQAKDGRFRPGSGSSRLLSVPIYVFTVYEFKDLPNRDYLSGDDRHQLDSSY